MMLSATGCATQRSRVGRKKDTVAPAVIAAVAKVELNDISATT